MESSSSGGPLDRLEDVMEFRHWLTPETDRGCALMAAAYLDDQLSELLLSRFVDDTKLKSELFGASQALGSFSSRIDFAYALGMIGPTARKELHIIRKIRNLFGHEPRPISFD